MPQIPLAITTPDKVESRIGTLDFKDGAPSAETVSKIYDNLDLMHPFEAFENIFQGVILEAAHAPRTRPRAMEGTTRGSLSPGQIIPVHPAAIDTLDPRRHITSPAAGR